MKKSQSFLSAAAGALLVLAAFVGCSDAPEIGTIQIANPEVKAESIFGANKITWADVDNATNYIVYRQLVTEEEVEVKTKKGTTTEIQEVLSELEEVGTVYATASALDYKVLDYAYNGSKNKILNEGAKIRYTVEAYRTDAVDGRAIATSEDLINFVHGKGTVDVTIAEGNMPAKGTQLAAPTTAEVKVSTRASNGAAIVEVTPDTIANDETVLTYLRCYANGTNDKDGIYWNYASAGWWTSTELEFPGLYDVYTYNVWNVSDNTYYDESEKVLAKEAVEVKATTSNEYNVPYITASSNNKVITLTWEADKTLTAANPTFTVSKYIVKRSWENNSDGGRYVYTILEKVGEVSIADKTVGTNGTSGYVAYDKDVKALPDGEYYQYILTAKAGEWIGRKVSNTASYTDGETTWNFTQSPYNGSRSVNYDYLTEDIKDKDGNKIGTKYTNKVNYYINGEVKLAKGETLKLTVSKYSTSTGLSAETDLKLEATTVQNYSDGSSYVVFTAINKDVARLNSANDEYYEYKLYNTNKYGLVKVYSWTDSTWDETKYLYNSVSLSVTTVTSTKDSITIPVTIDSYGQNVTVAGTTVRVVYSYVNKDKTITTKVLDTNGFEEDSTSAALNKPSKEKEIKITGLPADTTIDYYVFAIDANGVATTISPSTGSVTTLTE